ncbi:hypothetical protein [Nocardia xishanensis]|nr:hypothetical protein [Nocardia xishanensis]
MNVDDVLRWTLRTPGIAVPAARIGDLVQAAVRKPAGEARLPSED